MGVTSCRDEAVMPVKAMRTATYLFSFFLLAATPVHAQAGQEKPVPPLPIPHVAHASPPLPRPRPARSTPYPMRVAPNRELVPIPD